MPVIFEKSSGRRITCEKEQKERMLKDDRYVEDPENCDVEATEEAPEESDKGVPAAPPAPPGADSAQTGDGDNPFLQD